MWEIQRLGRLVRLGRLGGLGRLGIFKSPQSVQFHQFPKSPQSPRSPQSPQSSHFPQSPQAPKSLESPESLESPQSPESPQSQQFIYKYMCIFIFFVFLPCGGASHFRRGPRQVGAAARHIPSSVNTCSPTTPSTYLYHVVCCCCYYCCCCCFRVPYFCHVVVHPIFRGPAPEEMSQHDAPHHLRESVGNYGALGNY